MSPSIEPNLYLHCYVKHTFYFLWWKYSYLLTSSGHMVGETSYDLNSHKTSTQPFLVYYFIFKKPCVWHAVMAQGQSTTYVLRP